MEPNSPAAQAGLRAYTDYIIGTDALTNEVQDLADVWQRRLKEFNRRCSAGCWNWADPLGVSPVCKQDEDLFSIIEMCEGKELKLYVYSTDADNCREVLVTPDCGWGGEGRYARGTQTRAFHCLLYVRSEFLF